MTLVSKTDHPSNHRERSLSREPTDPQPCRDHSPTEPDRSGSVSPPRPNVYTHEHNASSYRLSGQNYGDRRRYRPRDRSEDRDINRKHDRNRSRVQAHDRDRGRDDDLAERPPYESNGRTADPNTKEWNRASDKDRGRYRTRGHQQDRNPTSHYQRYRPRSNYNDTEPIFRRDGNERRDYRQSDHSGRRYSKERHPHFSYDRWTSKRQNDHLTRSHHQGQYYQSSSHRRRAYSPRAAPSPSKSPMRRPSDSRRSSMLARNGDRLTKRRKLDDRSRSRSRNRETGLTRSTTPSRSRSRTPSHSYSRSRSRSRARSYSRSNSTDLYYHPVRSPSPIPPQPPRPPKSKLRPTSIARDCEVLAYDSLRSKSPSHSPRPPRQPRSFRSRTPPSEFSGSSLDGRPCAATTRSRSPRRSRSRSRADNRRPRHRSTSPSLVSGYSRTPFERRSISRSSSPRTSSDRRFSSSSRRPHRSLSRTCSSRGRSSSSLSPKRPRAYRRRRSIDVDIGPPPVPPRPPIGPRFAALDSSRRARAPDRWYARESNRSRDRSPPPLPPSPPTQRPELADQLDVDGTSKVPLEVESLVPVGVPQKAPLPISSPPTIPQPPRSPKRQRSNVHSARKAPGMPPMAPVAQTSAGVRRFFPGDDEEEDEAVVFPNEPLKVHATLNHSDEAETAEADIDPKPPSPSPPPLPPPQPSPPRFIHKSPSYKNYLRQRNYRRLSRTPSPPPSPPPAAAPPPPPALNSAVATSASSTAFTAHDFTHSRRTSSGQSRPTYSPRRRQYREGDSGEFSHSRRSSHRFSSRRDMRDAPIDASTDPLPPVATKDDRGRAQKPPPTNPTSPSSGHYNSTHPPPTVESHLALGYPTHHADNLSSGLPVPNASFPNYNAPPSASQPVEQMFVSHHGQFEGIRPAQGAASQAPINGHPSLTNGRRETKEVYERLVQVGEGTYGKVYKARNIETSELVAMKRIRMEAEKDGFPITAIREIKLLQGLRHPNIVNLVEMVVSKGHVYIVFEYMDHDLSGVLHHPHIHFSDAHTKSLMWQLLCGLQYMHERGVLHRDLKGSNILLNKSGQLKIADFGLARRFERGKEVGREGRGRGRDYTNRVITLWYKPPELLFGATIYGEEVDMWSAGAIFLELFTRRPIFQTGDEIDQLYATFKLMGTPTMTNWPEAFDLPWFELFKPKVEQPSRLRETFFGPEKNVKSEAGMALAERLLTLRPYDRPSAREALKSTYFTLEDPPMEMPTEILSNVKGEWHELESKRARRRRDL